MTPVSKRFLDSLQADHWILTKGQRRGAEGKLREYQVTFNLKEASLGRTKLVEHCRYNEPRKSLPLQFNPYGVRAAVEEKQALLDQGQFKVNSLEWNAPIVLVKRMDNSPWDFVWNIELYPLPLIEDILYQVSQSKWFSTLDLRRLTRKLCLFYAPGSFWVQKHSRG